MGADLRRVIESLAELTDNELHDLIDATYQAPRIAPVVLAWIDAACEWELNRRAGRHYPLPTPDSVIPPEEDPHGVDAAMALRAMFAKNSRAAHSLFDAIIELLSRRAGGRSRSRDMTGLVERIFRDRWRKKKYPSTSAVRVLRDHHVEFTHHPYTYVERGGTEVSALELGVPEHAVVKTLVMEDDRGNPLVVLMHGDREVSTKNLARLIGVKSVTPCVPAAADRHSGYQVGGTSPFGMRRAMPIYMERGIAALRYIYINGGRRGYLVGLDPVELVRVLKPIIADLATAKEKP